MCYLVQDRCKMCDAYILVNMFDKSRVIYNCDCYTVISTRQLMTGKDETMLDPMSMMLMM